MPYDNMNATSEQCEKVDFGTHEVMIKTDIDFAETGLIMAQSKVNFRIFYKMFVCAFLNFN